MPRAFRVRFSNKSRSIDQNFHIDAASDPALALTRVHRKSRYGCQQCRIKRVKCDETFPKCIRCQRQRSACNITIKPSRWHLERPDVYKVLSVPAPTCSLPVDTSLLQWWLDSACKLFVLDLHSNPLSFPLMEHLAVSPALCLTLESFSAGHKGWWAANSRIECLKKRNLALGLCRAELISEAVPLETVFFTVLLLGISTPFTENIDDYGKEHLIGARAILSVLLQQEEFKHSPTSRQLLAYYIWWDMACSFSINTQNPQELPPLSTSDVFAVINYQHQPLGSHFAGCMVEVYHLLGLLLRYCMQILRGSVRDLEYEEMLEQALLDWQPTQVRDEDVLFGEAFKMHGLIIFYRICHLRSANVDDGASIKPSLICEIHEYATKIVSMILPLQIGTPFWNSLIVPLLTAGAELSIDDLALRNNVREAFSSVCFQCRTNTLMRARDLLEEVWVIRDSGGDISYMELMLQKGWNFSLV